MKKALAFILIMASSTAYAAEIWDVREGEGKEAPQSKWTMQIQGAMAVGAGEAQVNGSAEKFNIHGQLKPDGYTLQTQGHGQADRCIYHGKASSDGSSIVGTMFCNNKPKPWLVTVRK